MGICPCTMLFPFHLFSCAEAERTSMWRQNGTTFAIVVHMDVLVVAAAVVVVVYCLIYRKD